MSKFHCPRCGAILEVNAVQSAPWTRQEMDVYALGDVQLSSGATWYRREPAREPVREDVLVLVAWAGITGLAIGLGAVPLTMWQSWPWWTPAGVAAGGFAISWLMLLADWRKALWRVEEITHADLDGDKIVGEPERKPDVVHIELEEQQQTGRRVRYLDLPVSDEEIHRVAVAVLLHQRPFSRRALADLLSDTKFRKLQRAMIEAGLAFYPGGPNAGAELTAAGRAILRHYLNHQVG